MLINRNTNQITNISNYSKANLDRYVVYWKGLIATESSCTGIDAIEEIIKVYSQKKKIDFNHIWGAFHCLIVDLQTNDIMVFTDNNKLRCFYKSDNFISDNMLEILMSEEQLSVDKIAVTEFLIYGQCFFNKTIVQSVSLSDTNCFYVLNKGCMVTNSKGLIGFDEHTNISTHKYTFGNISKFLSKYRTSLALTGGYDSRYVLALLNEVNLDTCISGNNLSNKDFILSKRVAKAFGKRHFNIIVKKPNINEQFIQKMYESFGGIFVGFGDSAIRIYQMLNKLKKAGYLIHLTGDTGVLHKGENWIMDFPFYSKKKFNVVRYYNFLIMPIKKHIPLTVEYAQYGLAIKQNIISWMNENKKVINTKSYDYYELELAYEYHRRTVDNAESQILDIYSPLMEREAIRYSYNLKRFLRYRATAMKKNITSINKKAARLSTTTGTSASSELAFRLKDIFIDFWNISIKAMRLIGRKIFKKTYFIQKVIDWSCEKELYDLNISSEALEYLKKIGIVEEQLNIKEVSFDFLERAIFIYLTFNNKIMRN